MSPADSIINCSESNMQDQNQNVHFKVSDNAKINL